MTVALIPYLYESLLLTYAWDTDVIAPPGADETRICLASHPQISLRVTYALLEDAQALQRQEIRGLLFSDTEITYEIPIRIEAVVVLADVVDENVVVPRDASRDWALVVGMRVYVETDEDEQGYAATIVDANIVGDTIEVELDETPPATMPQATTRVCPLWLVQPKPDPTLGRYRSAEAGTWTLTGTSQTFYDQGTFLSATTFDEDFVLESPYVSEGEVAEGFDQGLELDGFPAVEARSLLDVSRVKREVEYTTDLGTPWLVWKEILFGLRGQQGAFWLPTGRDDLILDAQPSSPTSVLIVRDDPDYRLWHGHQTHDYLQLALSDGTFGRVYVSSIVDNLDGTLTLNLLDPFARGAATIDVVSFLERARLGDDNVTVRHEPGDFLTLKLTTLVGPWT